MLKIVRELAVDNPWVLKIIMGVIAITFVITMGWWGIKQPKENVVVIVNGHNIKVQDYRRAYNRTVEYYRDAFKDKFDADMLEKMNVKDKVVEDLVKRELWLDAANGLGLMVSDGELRDNIMKMTVFHKDGRFSSTLYERLLASNRMKAGDFEALQRSELLIEKMKRIVKDSVQVTDDEVNEAYPLSAAGKPSTSAKSPTVTERPAEEMSRLKKFMQFQKQEKAVMAYANAMRSAAKINVKKELL
ncbi:MAG: SurA N-terminal domain-containing protein [Nitrospirae bacterium]|nr:SurA N-terminal domain-containing protein [Nitrospirota bacterium]